MFRPSRFLSLSCLALLSASLACEKKPRELAPPPEPEVVLDTRMPLSLLAVATMGAPEADLARLGGLLDALTPGAGAYVKPTLFAVWLGKLVGLKSLDGAVLSRPVHVLFLNPREFRQPVVLLVAVGDARQLRATVQRAGAGARLRTRDGYAVIGAGKALDAVAGYALGAVARRPPPAAPTVTLYTAPLLAAFRSDVLAFKQQFMAMAAGQPQLVGVGRLLGLEIDLLVKLAEQTERMELTVEASREAGTFELVAVPRAGTDLERLFRAQRPSDYALLGRLPASGDAMVMVGHFELGPVRDAGIGVMSTLFGEMFGHPVDPAMRERMVALMDNGTGEVAAVMQPGGFGAMQVTEIFEVADGPRAQKLTGELIRQLASWGELDVMGIFRLRFRYQPAAFRYDGIAIDAQHTRFSIDPSMPEDVRREMARLQDEQGVNMVAGFDKLLVFTVGKGAREDIKAAIDAARRGQNAFVPAAGLRAALDESRARKESGLVFMNLAALMKAVLPFGAPAGGPTPSGLTMGIGFEGGVARVRMTLPVAHIREITQR